MTNPNDININVHVNGLAHLNALSAGLRNINATLAGSAQGAKNFDARQRSLNTALGVGKDGAKAHAKSLGEVIRNQSALGNELRRSTADYKNLTKSQFFATQNTTKAAGKLHEYNSALKGIKARVLVSDLKAISGQMVLTGKNVQWTGRQLMTGLTLPMLAFGRIALGSFAAVDKELTKLDKILEDVAMTTDRALIKMQVAGANASERLAAANDDQLFEARKRVQAFKELEAAFTDLARTFGDNKALVISLGVDFAQLGLSTNGAVTSLTEAVLMAEKLGDVDISQGKDLIQTIYFQATKMLDANAVAHDDVKNAVERENEALKIVNGTLAQFNLIENTTVLSLNDIARALPEAGAAATQFGLSMVETMGLLAPMKAAGFDVASSANAIKVSLQRLNDPTEESKQMLADLTRVLGFDFAQATHIGINSIDYLAQAFQKVKDEGAGVEGAMEFMTQLFVLRQGPRMAESIGDIAEFNAELEQLDRTGNTTDQALKTIVDTANELKTKGSAVPLIKSYSDLGNIARISTMHLSRDVSKNVIELIENGRTVTKTITAADKKEAQDIRTAVGDVVLQARRDGEDLVSTINSQVGKVMVAQLVGVEEAGALAQQEVDIALKSVSEATSRIRVNFQLIAVQLIKGFKPVIEFIDRAMQSISKGMENLSTPAKTMISVSLVGLAAIGPLMYAFGLAKTAVGTLTGAFFKLLPSLSTFTAQTLTMSPALMNLTNPIVMVGSTFTTSASRSALFTANLASMDGPIGAAARQIGYLTGALQKESTAAMEATAAVQAHKAAVASGGATGGVATAGSILGTGVQTRPSISPALRAQLAAQAGILGPQVAAGAYDPIYLKNMARSKAIGLPMSPMDHEAQIEQAMLARHANVGGSLTPAGKMARFGATNRGNRAMSAPLIAQQRTRTLVNMRRAARLGLDQNVVDLMPSVPTFDPMSEQRTMEKFGTTRTRLTRQAVDRRFVRGTKQRLTYTAGAGSTPGAPVARAQYRMASLFKQGPGSGVDDYSRLVTLSPKAENRIVKGGILGALEKAKQRVTPTLSTLKTKTINGVKAVGRGVKGAFNQLGRLMEGSFRTMEQFFAGFSGIFQNPLPAISKGFSNMATMFAAGYTRVTLSIKTGIAKTIAAIKSGQFAQWIVKTAKDPIGALKNLGNMIKVRYLQFAAFMNTTKLGATGVQTRLNALKFKQINFLKSILGVNAFKKAIYETRFALLQAQAQQAAGNYSSAFQSGVAAVKAFTKSLMSSIKIMKLVKIAMMGMGIIGVVFAAVAVVMTLVQNFKKLGSAGDGTKKTFKETFEIIKDVFNALIKPFKDLLQTFMDMAAGTTGTKSQFESLANKIKSVAEAVKAFVEKYIVPALNFMLVGSVNMVRGLVKVIQGFINIFKGDWKKGLFQMLQGLVLFVGVGVKLLIKFATLFVQAYAFLYKKILEIVAGIATGMGNIMGAAIKWIIMKFHDLVKTLTGFMKHIPGLKQIRSMVLTGIEAAANGLDAAFSGIGKLIGGIANGMGSLIEVVEDGAVAALNGIGNLAQSGFDKVIESTKKLSDSAGKEMVDDAEAHGKEFADVFTDPIASGLDDIIDNASGELASMLKDLKQQFVDLVLGEVADQLSQATEAMKSALEEQKTAALAVFDTQIETLEKLAKAEESLTKEKEYQAERRKMIDERALQAQNYVRNRALAIYEGRIDDARMLNLEDQKNNIDFQSSLSKIEETRRKDLAQENLEALKEAINKAKAEADKFFDDQIKAFEDAAKAITKFPPQTIEEYEAQLGQLNTIAGTIATENGVIFQDMLNKMKTDIKLPNEGVGVFSTSLDALVVAAKEKYGLTDTASENSIIGATIGMLAGIEGQIVGNQETITTAFTGIVTDVFDVASGFSTIATGIVEPAMSAIEQVLIDKNPFTVFETAIKNANTTLLREITGTVGAVGSIVDNLATRLDPLISKLATINFLKDQAESNPPAAGPSNTDLPGGSTPGTGAAPSADTYDSIFRQVKANIAAQTNAAFTILNGAEKLELARTSTNVILDVFIRAMGKTAAAKKAFYKLEMDKIADPLVRTIFNHHFSVGGTGYANGGFVPRFGKGGYNVPGFNSQPIPAMLHGGEYVINSKAVSNVGMATLSMLNDMRFKKPNYDAPVSNGGGSSCVTTTNIYVDNFIGEDKWFQEMLKQYNMNVLPNNQKSAGMENRVVKSYSGLSRGM
jgi:hypothetical protein